MSLDSGRYDVVVIGGGFAGVTMARDLTEQGNTVLLLEGRDRLGGRTWSTKFPGTDVDIELGGTFILSDRWPAVMREMERYNIQLHWAHEVDCYPTILNGKHYPGPSPVPFEQIFELERVAIHCIKAAARIQPGMPLDHQGLEDLDIPLSEFLAPLELPPETYDYFTALADLLSFRLPEEGSALQYLHGLATMDLSVMSLWGAMATYIRTGDLVGAIAADVTEVRLECPVVRVDQTGDDVLVTTAEGETISASAVVVATPINVWNDIEFVPELSETKRITSAERHGADRSGKAWVRTRNALKNPFLIAAPQHANGGLAIYTEHDLENGDQLMCMFGLVSVEGDDFHWSFDDRESVERTLQALLPGAELVDYISHNYNTDPFSKGDWISWRPGRISKSHSVLGAPEGRVAFATADVAPKWLMMIEGAIECGHRAAHQTLPHLVRAREAVVAQRR